MGSFFNIFFAPISKYKIKCNAHCTIRRIRRIYHNPRCFIGNNLKYIQHLCWDLNPNNSKTGYKPQGLSPLMARTVYDTKYGIIQFGPKAGLAPVRTNNQFRYHTSMHFASSLGFHCKISMCYYQILYIVCEIVISQINQCIHHSRYHIHPNERSLSDLQNFVSREDDF